MGNFKLWSQIFKHSLFTSGQFCLLFKQTLKLSLSKNTVLKHDCYPSEINSLGELSLRFMGFLHSQTSSVQISSFPIKSLLVETSLWSLQTAERIGQQLNFSFECLSGFDGKLYQKSQISLIIFSKGTLYWSGSSIIWTGNCLNYSIMSPNVGRQRATYSTCRSTIVELLSEELRTQEKF